MATEVGLFVIKDTDGALADTGKYLIIWKKEQGQWKYHRDIWSSPGKRDSGPLGTGRWERQVGECENFHGPIVTFSRLKISKIQLI